MPVSTKPATAVFFDLDADFLLVKAGSGALTFGNPTSAGVPAETAAQTLVLDYNDVAGLAHGTRLMSHPDIRAPAP